MDKVTYMNMLDAALRDCNAQTYQRELWHYELKFKEAQLRGENPDSLASKLPHPKFVAARAKLIESYQALDIQFSLRAFGAFLVNLLGLLFLSVLMIGPFIAAFVSVFAITLSGLLCFAVGLMLSISSVIDAPTYSIPVSFEPHVHTSAYTHPHQLDVTINRRGIQPSNLDAVHDVDHVDTIQVRNETNTNDLPWFLGIAIVGLFMLYGGFKGLTYFALASVKLFKWSMETLVAPFHHVPTGQQSVK